MPTTDKIIDACIKAIGDEITDPQMMTRAEVLSICNQVYIDCAKRIKSLVSYSYDASDADHTITAGVATLPSDFLLMHRVYDGDAYSQDPIKPIQSIDDKVADTAALSQYMIPNQSQIWFYGQTPTNTVKLYYYEKGAALTDAVSSTPSLLNELFHTGVKGIFEIAVKCEYAKRLNNTYDMMDMYAPYEDLLNEIEAYHNEKKYDDTPPMVKMEW